MRFVSSKDAEQAIINMDGAWVWGQKLVVKKARFLKKKDVQQVKELYNDHRNRGLTNTLSSESNSTCKPNKAH